MHFFDQLPNFSPDSILGLQKVFLQDHRENKINLIIGTYELPTKKYGGFSSVRKAQNVFLESEMNKSYLPIQGHPAFLSEFRELIFTSKYSNFVTDCQALGGTGALHLGAKIYAMSGLANKVYIPEQTWGNHSRIFDQEGIEVVRYPYYDHETKTLRFDLIRSMLEQAPKGSLILFHCCCHNPTGLDFSAAMWQTLAEICKDKCCIPFFDAAYLGFSQGFDEDKQPIQLFLDSNIPVFVAACGSKNFSLYGERIGYFAVHFKNESALEKIQSCLQEKIRGEYSSPSRHGASIIATILGNPYLRQEWLSELNGARESLKKIRARFVQTLRGLVGHTFDYLLTQNGFFGFPSFTAEQVKYLKEQKGIYTTAFGRFNLNGITEQNIGYIAQSFLEAMDK